MINNQWTPFCALCIYSLATLAMVNGKLKIQRIRCLGFTLSDTQRSTCHLHFLDSQLHPWLCPVKVGSTSHLPLPLLSQSPWWPHSQGHLSYSHHITRIPSVTWSWSFYGSTLILQVFPRHCLFVVFMDSSPCLCNPHFSEIPIYYALISKLLKEQV